MTQKKFYLQLTLLTIVVTFISACIGHQSTDETTTRGKIKVSVDEAFRLIMDSQIHTFMNSYIHSEIIPVYISEGEAIDLLLEDSVRFAMVSRELTEKERAYFDERKIIPRITKVATDGVAFILNNQNPDSTFTIEQLSQIVNGKISSWDALNKNNKAGSISVVFDHNRSGTARFIKETFLVDSFPSYCYAVNNNAEVINYVEANPNAIGVIGVNWISDSRDSVSIDFLKRIKVAAISKESDNPNFVKPYQGYLANGDYPLLRDVLIISRESFTGLGTGFASFIAGDKGQRIILKAGLVPATAPVRLVNVGN
ncbi:MAG: PstS family phosphate ABC transporter substrate-binding protein [Flavobacteriales bacterium]